MSPLVAANRIPTGHDTERKRPAPAAISKNKVSTLITSSTCPVFLIVCARARTCVDGFTYCSSYLCCESVAPQRSHSKDTHALMLGASGEAPILGVGVP